EGRSKPSRPSEERQRRERQARRVRLSVIRGQGCRQGHSVAVRTELPARDGKGTGSSERGNATIGDTAASAGSWCRRHNADAAGRRQEADAKLIRRPSERFNLEGRPGGALRFYSTVGR